MSEQMPPEDITNNSISESTKSTEIVNYQSDLNKIKEFIKNAKNNQVVNESTQAKILQFIELLENQDLTPEASNNQLIIQEIKEFQEKIKRRQVLNPQTRKALIELIDNLQHIDFTENDFQCNTAEGDIQTVRDFIVYIEKECYQLDLEQVYQTIQKEVAELLSLSQKIESLIYKNLNKPSKRQELKLLVAYLRVALQSLLQKNPNIDLARQIRRDIQRVIHKYEYSSCLALIINRFYIVRVSDSTPLKVIYGLITTLSLTVGVTTFIVLQSFLSNQYFNPTSKLIRDKQTAINEVTNELKELNSKDYQIEINNLTDSIDDISKKIKATKEQAAENQKKIDEAIKQEKKNLNPVGSEIKKSSVQYQEEQKNILQNFSGLQQQLKEEQEKLFNIQKDQLNQNESIKIKTEEVEQYQDDLASLQVIRLKDTRHSNNLTQFILVVAAGTLGSIISILIRIEEFQNKSYPDPIIPFFVGAFKPIIGASFAIFVFTLLSSEVIVIPSIHGTILNQNSNLSQTSTAAGNSGETAKISTDKEILAISKAERKRTYFIFAIAFVVGFSERIAKDAIEKVENTLTNNPENYKYNSNPQGANNIKGSILPPVLNTDNPENLEQNTGKND